MIKAIIFQLTGEKRPPLQGEWFSKGKGLFERARFNFGAISLPILKQSIVDSKSVAHEGDPCKFCGKPHDEVPIGPCRGRCFAGFILEEK